MSSAEYEVSVPHPKKRSIPARICRFIYNSDTKEFLGRTCLSWGQIILFYIIYYAILAGFFVAMISILLFGILSDKEPLLTGQQSLLREGPGLGIFPLLNTSSNSTPDTTLIDLDRSDTSKKYKAYQTHIEHFFLQYQNQKGVLCDTNNDSHITDDVFKVCKFDLTSLGPCNDPVKELSLGNLCVFLRMNRIYGWIPEMTSDDFTTPVVSCTGQNDPDTENLGTLEYFPAYNSSYGKFSHAYFPFLNQENYISPIVAVRMKNLAKNVVILVECSISGLSWTPSITFEIMLDDLTAK